MYRPDAGEIAIYGRPVRIDGLNMAISLGIGMVHQHFKLVEPFTVTENMILGAEPTKNADMDYRRARQEVTRLSEQCG